MHAPTPSNPSDAPLSASDLRSKIREALTDGLTGQIQIAFQNGRRATLFAHRGHVRLVYIRNHRAPKLDWELLLDQFGEGALDIQPMPARVLGFKKIVLEELKTPKPQPAGTAQLTTMFDLAARNAAPTLFHIRWETAEAFALIAGRSMPLRRAAMLHQAGGAEETVDLDQLSAWEEADCNVTVYQGDVKNPAWLEVHLNILFEWFCAHILKQYSLLTGMVMVRSVLRSVDSLAEKNDWIITTQDLEVKDSTLFTDPAAAGDAYREILLSILDLIVPVVGNSLTRFILKQAVESTRDGYKSIMEVYHLTRRAKP